MHYDVIVIGGGPGGYIASLATAQMGANVLLVEREHLGGTCLNWGCIPSKHLIQCAKQYSAMNRLHEWGITSPSSTGIHYPSMVDKRNEIISCLRKNIEQLLQSRNIMLLQGEGKLIDSRTVRVEGASEWITCEKIILSPGARPCSLPRSVDPEGCILSPKQFFDLKELPKKLTIIGGGVIGCELASCCHQLGTEVSLVEMLPRILSTESSSVSQYIEEEFKRMGISVLTATQAQSIRTSTDKGPIRVEAKRHSEKLVWDTNAVLSATGILPNSDSLGSLSTIGIATHPRGWIDVNQHMQTSIPNIYAIGDVTGILPLAHCASHQGLVAAHHATGEGTQQDQTMDYSAIPSVIFTNPEVASVGLSLHKALEQGWDALASSFPFSSLGIQHVLQSMGGFANIVTERNTGRLLGGVVVGNGASSLIAEWTLAIQNELTLESIMHTVHAHPTSSEIWHEIAHKASSFPLHAPPPTPKGGVP